MMSQHQQPDSWSSTTHQIVKFTHRWVVDDLRFYLKSSYQKDQPLIESPDFSPPTDSTLKFSLTLYPNGSAEAEKGYASIYLKLLSCPKFEMRVQGKVSIVDQQGTKQNTVIITAKLYSKEPGWGYGKYITHEKLNSLLTNDKLTIFCEIEAMLDSFHTTSVMITNMDTRIEAHHSDNMDQAARYLFESAFEHETTKRHEAQVPTSGYAIDKVNTRIETELSNNFGHLLKSSKLSDIVLVSGDTTKTEHRAHKAILYVRSPVFASMLEQDTDSNEFLIADTEGDVIEEILRFIYTGKVLNLDELADKLLIAADNYGLDQLKDVCEKYIAHNLNTENAISMLLFADKHSILLLRSKAIEYIKANLFTLVETDKWQTVKEKPELHFELLSQTVTYNQGKINKLSRSFQLMMSLNSSLFSWTFLLSIIVFILAIIIARF